MVELNELEMIEIATMVAQVTETGFADLSDLACVDDVAMARIQVSQCQIDTEIPVCPFLCPPRDKRLRVRYQLFGIANAQLELFKKIWKFCDKHAPYTLKKHEQRSNKGRQHQRLSGVGAA